MEINLPNNTAWKKSEPPRLSYNSDTKMKCEMWTPQGEPLPTLKEIETLEETSTHDVKLKKGDEYVEICEDDEDDIYEFDSDYSEDDDC